jgi:pSer/pThr/pTyr-binding forkhead associated (FHA) protein
LLPQGEHAGKPALALGHHEFTQIGSRNRAHLHLVSSTISRNHACIIATKAGLYIRDLGSRTGVIVNGRRVKEVDIQDGDILQVGSFKFEFQEPLDAVHLSTTPRPPAAVLDTGGGAQSPLNDRTIVIGRRQSCDILLDTDSVSSTHAIIFECDGKRFVRDLGSRTGTIVNGTKIHQRALELGDKVQIGETTLRYLPAAGAGAKHAQAAAATAEVDRPAGEEDDFGLDFDDAPMPPPAPEAARQIEPDVPIEAEADEFKADEEIPELVPDEEPPAEELLAAPGSAEGTGVGGQGPEGEGVGFRGQGLAEAHEMEPVGEFAGEGLALVAEHVAAHEELAAGHEESEESVAPYEEHFAGHEEPFAGHEMPAGEPEHAGDFAGHVAEHGADDASADVIPLAEAELPAGAQPLDEALPPLPLEDEELAAPVAHVEHDKMLLPETEAAQEPMSHQAEVNEVAAQERGAIESAVQPEEPWDAELAAEDHGEPLAPEHADVRADLPLGQEPHALQPHVVGLHDEAPVTEAATSPHVTAQRDETAEEWDEIFGKEEAAVEASNLLAGHELLGQQIEAAGPMDEDQAMAALDVVDDEPIVSESQPLADLVVEPAGKPQAHEPIPAAAPAEIASLEPVSAVELQPAEEATARETVAAETSADAGMVAALPIEAGQIDLTPIEAEHVAMAHADAAHVETTATQDVAPVETAPVEAAPIAASHAEVHAEQIPVDPAPVEAPDVEAEISHDEDVAVAPIEAAHAEVSPVDAHDASAIDNSSIDLDFDDALPPDEPDVSRTPIRPAGTATLSPAPLVNVDLSSVHFGSEAAEDEVATAEPLEEVVDQVPAAQPLLNLAPESSTPVAEEPAGLTISPVRDSETDADLDDDGPSAKTDSKKSKGRAKKKPAARRAVRRRKVATTDGGAEFVVEAVEEGMPANPLVDETDWEEIDFPPDNSKLPEMPADAPSEAAALAWLHSKSIPSEFISGKPGTSHLTVPELSPSSLESFEPPFEPAAITSKTDSADSLLESGVTASSLPTSDDAVDVSYASDADQASLATAGVSHAIDLPAGEQSFAAPGMDLAQPEIPELAPVDPTPVDLAPVEPAPVAPLAGEAAPAPLALSASEPELAPASTLAAMVDDELSLADAPSAAGDDSLPVVDLGPVAPLVFENEPVVLEPLEPVRIPKLQVSEPRAGILEPLIPAEGFDAPPASVEAAPIAFEPELPELHAEPIPLGVNEFAPEMADVELPPGDLPASELTSPQVVGEMPESSLTGMQMDAVLDAHAITPAEIATFTGSDATAETFGAVDITPTAETPAQHEPTGEIPSYAAETPAVSTNHSLEEVAPVAPLEKTFAAEAHAVHVDVHTGAEPHTVSAGQIESIPEIPESHAKLPLVERAPLSAEHTQAVAQAQMPEPAAPEHFEHAEHRETAERAETIDRTEPTNESALEFEHTLAKEDLAGVTAADLHDDQPAMSDSAFNLAVQEFTGVESGPLVEQAAQPASQGSGPELQVMKSDEPTPAAVDESGPIEHSSFVAHSSSETHLPQVPANFTSETVLEKPVEIDLAPAPADALATMPPVEPFAVTAFDEAPAIQEPAPEPPAVRDAPAELASESPAALASLAVETTGPQAPAAAATMAPQVSPMVSQVAPMASQVPPAASQVAPAAAAPASEAAESRVPKPRVNPYFGMERDQGSFLGGLPMSFGPTVVLNPPGIRTVQIPATQTVAPPKPVEAPAAQVDGAVVPGARPPAEPAAFPVAAQDEPAPAAVSVNSVASVASAPTPQAPTARVPLTAAALIDDEPLESSGQTAAAPESANDDDEVITVTEEFLEPEPAADPDDALFRAEEPLELFDETADQLDKLPDALPPISDVSGALADVQFQSQRTSATPMSAGPAAATVAPAVASPTPPRISITPASGVPSAAAAPVAPAPQAATSSQAAPSAPPAQRGPRILTIPRPGDASLPTITIKPSMRTAPPPAPNAAPPGPNAAPPAPAKSIVPPIVPFAGARPHSKGGVTAFSGVTVPKVGGSDVFSQTAFPPMDEDMLRPQPIDSPPVSVRDPGEAPIPITARPRQATPPQGAGSKARDPRSAPAQPQAPAPKPAVKETQPEEEPRKKKKSWWGSLKLLFPVFLLLAAGSVGGIMTLLSPRTLVQGTLEIKGLDKLDWPTNKAQIRKIRDTLSNPDLKNLVAANLSSQNVPAGFAQDSDAIKDLADPKNSTVAGDAITFSRVSADPEDDKKRMNAVLQVLYAENKTTGEQAVAAKPQIQAKQDTVDALRKQLDDWEKSFAKLSDDVKASTGNASEDLLSNPSVASTGLMQRGDELRKAMEDANAHVKSAQAEVDAAQVAGAAAGGAPNAKTIEIRRNLAAANSRLEVARQAAQHQAMQSVQTFEDAIQLVDQDMMVTGAVTREPKLMAYLVQARRATSELRQLITRQSEDTATLAELRRQLVSRQQAHLSQVWEKDETLNQYLNDRQTKLGLLSTAAGTGNVDDVPKLRGELEDLDQRIDARRQSLATGAQYADDLQQKLAQAIDRLEDDRQHNQKRMTDDLAALDAPAAGSLPPEQQGAVVAIGEHVASAKAAWEDYQSNSSKAVADAESKVRKLESQVAELQSQLDSYQQESRQASVAAARRSLASAQELEGQAQAAYVNNLNLLASVRQMSDGQARRAQLAESLRQASEDLTRVKAEAADIGALEPIDAKSVTVTYEKDQRAWYTLGALLLLGCLLTLLHWLGSQSSEEDIPYAHFTTEPSRDDAPVTEADLHDLGDLLDDHAAVA